MGADLIEKQLLTVNVRNVAHVDYYDYINCWKKRMQEAYTVASETATKEAARGKILYTTTGK